MKPLTVTSGMKEGSENESKVLKLLPNFFAKNLVSRGEAFQADYNMRENFNRSITIEYIRTVDLLGGRDVLLLAGSPDGIVGYRDGSPTNAVAVEIKTMTSLRTIQAAKSVCESYCEIVHLSGIGYSEYATRLFHKLVPTSAYRLQCMHHAAVLCNEKVIFVVAKGCDTGVGGIIYAVLLEFSRSIVANYKFCLSGIRSMAFSWVGQEAKHIPDSYDDLLQKTYVTDLFSFVSFYNISKAYKDLCSKQGPLVPARMIRPTCLVYWNHLKGGVDEFSRNMKNLSSTNSSENPIVSVIGRLLGAQVNNAGIVFRLLGARNRNLLPTTIDQCSIQQKGYRRLRHNVTKCMSFSSFAKQLAKEFALEYKRLSVQQTSPALASSNLSENVVMKPMYTRNVVQNYNRDNDANRRLANSSLHVVVNAKAPYCSLYSFSYSVKRGSKVFTKKGGSKVVQWCGLCRQPVCSSCWDSWYSKRLLGRAAISTDELQELEEKAEA